jgi:hypothetical protein
LPPRDRLDPLPAPGPSEDDLRLRATVIEARRSERKPELGILRWRWQLFNQQDVEVLDLEVTSLFDLAPTPDPPPEPPHTASPTPSPFQLHYTFHCLRRCRPP